MPAFLHVWYRSLTGCLPLSRHCANARFQKVRDWWFSRRCANHLHVAGMRLVRSVAAAWAISVSRTASPQAFNSMPPGARHDHSHHQHEGARSSTNGTATTTHVSTAAHAHYLSGSEHYEYRLVRFAGSYVAYVQNMRASTTTSGYGTSTHGPPGQLRRGAPHRRRCLPGGLAGAEVGQCSGVDRDELPGRRLLRTPPGPGDRSSPCTTATGCAWLTAGPGSCRRRCASRARCCSGWTATCALGDSALRTRAARPGVSAALPLARGRTAVGMSTLKPTSASLAGMPPLTARSPSAARAEHDQHIT